MLILDLSHLALMDVMTTPIYIQNVFHVPTSERVLSASLDIRIFSYTIASILREKQKSRYL